MTSLDSINLDDYQDLSQDEENVLSQITPYGTTGKSSSSFSQWSPLIIAIVITAFAYIINSEWINQKLQEVPYYRFALFGILFAVVLLLLLFL